MSRSQVDGVGLLVAVLATAVALTLLPGPFAWFGSICGLLLLFTLLAYDGEGSRTLFESLAFSAVLALTATVAAAIPLRIVAVSEGQPAGFEGTLVNQWLPLFWLGVTILFWPIDRARMSSRVQYAAETVSPPVAPQPRRQAIVGPYEHVDATQPVFRPEPPAPVQPLPVPSGPEVTIYVTLVGEGLNVLRGVQAEHLGRDFYKIIEPMPEGETWQYGPGQVVRCKKKNLSGGKALVAIEEAPRAR